MANINLVNKPYTNILKEGATDNLYQSTFLPIFQKAETEIKVLILTALLRGTPLFDLRLAIAGVIAAVKAKIPVTLHDREIYLNGLAVKSNVFIQKYYMPSLNSFYKVKTEIMRKIETPVRKPAINNPQQLLDLVAKPTTERSLWANVKGSPNVTNYERELKKRILSMAEDPVTTYEPGKKPISLWQKAELDVRWEHQVQMLQDLRVQGVEYAWTSSHPNCSKRCQKWQGKLMALNQNAEGPNFVVGKLDGHTVYSLPDIMNQVDRWGYRNNIIIGFNCRHRLIPYKPGVYGPEKYTDKEVAKQRAIEAKMREMERKIRNLKTKELLCSKMGDEVLAKEYRKQWKALFEYYKRFCEQNGYAWYQYRCNI